MLKIEGLLGRTLRALPSGVSPAMGIAARASLMRPGPGGWIVLPLGARILDRMTTALLKDLECQQVVFLTDQRGRPGQALSDLMHGETQSHRHLPLRVATLWHGRVAPNASVAQVHTLLCLASASAEEGDLSAFLGKAVANVRRVAASAGLDIASVAGAGGSSALMIPGPSGGSIAVSCAACHSSHLHEAAPFAREQLTPSAPRPPERVHTPGASTIQALASMLGVGRERTLKALFMTGESGETVFALVRGDLDASLEKLAGVVGARELRPATDSEIAAVGAVAGFAGPMGMHVRDASTQDGVHVVADPSVFTGNDFAVGANAPDYHLVHVDPSRDFSVTQVADIALAPSDARCAACGAALAQQRGTIVAVCSPLAGPLFSDENGAEGRAAAALTTVDLLALFEQVVGACADDSGIAWPASMAPADVHVISLREPEASREAARRLDERGLSVLLDDRPIGAGPKFVDADLIGCPLRLTVSSRSLQAGGAELAGRRGVSPSVVPLEALANAVGAKLGALMST